MPSVYIGIGSNIDPYKNIEKAIKLLNEFNPIEKISTFYKTPPLNKDHKIDPTMDFFLNGVIMFNTTLLPKELKFKILKPIEKKLRRERDLNLYSARTIDLDILLFGDIIINETNITIPDPDILHRPFIHISLLELDDKIIIPGTDAPLKKLISKELKMDIKPEIEYTNILRRSIGL